MLYYVLLRVIFGRIKKEHDTDFIQIFMHDSRLLEVVKRNQHTVIAQYDSLIID